MKPLMSCLATVSLFASPAHAITCRATPESPQCTDARSCHAPGEQGNGTYAELSEHGTHFDFCGGERCARGTITLRKAVGNSRLIIGKISPSSQHEQGDVIAIIDDKKLIASVSAAGTHWIMVCAPSK